MQDQHQLAAFYIFGCSGMNLMEHAPAAPTPPTHTPRPLLNRCACGRAISANKRACLACANPPPA